jgi:transcriptional regulator with XRE-family HTH domain
VSRRERSFDSDQNSSARARIALLRTPFPPGVDQSLNPRYVEKTFNEGFMGLSFGERLRRWRKKRGLSQRELARQAGIDFTYVSKVENDVPGFERLSEEALTRLADALDVDADEMITGAGKVPADVRRILVDDFSLVKEIRERKGGYGPGGPS